MFDCAIFLETQIGIGNKMHDTDYRNSLIKEISELEQEHKDLDTLISDPESSKIFSQFTFQKLKKRKLFLKDKIIALKDELYPDIIA